MKNPCVAAGCAARVAGTTRIGLGCMALTGLYGQISRSEAKETILGALASGVRLFDTAPLYGNGENETLLGEVLGRKPKICIVTKFGLSIGNTGRMYRDSSPRMIRRSVEGSLQRLRRQRIDLLLQHRPDGRTPDEDVAGVVAELVQEGKVDRFGLSSTTLMRARRLEQMVPVSAVENELSLLSATSEGRNPNDFERMGLAYLAYSPLARGALTSVVPRTIDDKDDYRSRLPHFTTRYGGLISIVLAAVAKCAVRHHVDPSAVCLAWVLARGESVVAIPGARSPEQVAAALKAANVVLATEEIQGLDDLRGQFTRQFAEKV